MENFNKKLLIHIMNDYSIECDAIIDIYLLFVDSNHRISFITSVQTIVQELNKNLMEFGIVPKYHFVFSSKRSYPKLCNRNVQELLQKWGIDFQIQQYSFNKSFHHCHKYDLAEAFIKDRKVLENLKEGLKAISPVEEIVTVNIDEYQIPCSVTSMSFFEKLKNPKNNIVSHSGSLHQRLHSEINGVLVADNLRAMILDETCNEFSLYSKDERNEFIFRIFQLLVLGGQYCQYEDNLEPYLEITKIIYKDLVRIRKHDDNVVISTIVLPIVIKIDTPRLPGYSGCMQNIGFLLIDGNNRNVTMFLHGPKKYQ